MPPDKKILLTGPPGIGKTTVVRGLAELLDDLRPVGFYTEEIRVRGTRQGFMLADFKGRSQKLAHVDFSGPFRVGKYGVDVPGFENFLEGIEFFSEGSGLILLDEIGKMECHSLRFCHLIEEIMERNKPVVATISQKGGGLIARLKKRNDIVLIEIALANRNGLPAQIAAAVRRNIG